MRKETHNCRKDGNSEFVVAASPIFLSCLLPSSISCFDFIDLCWLRNRLEALIHFVCCTTNSTSFPSVLHDSDIPLSNCFRLQWRNFVSGRYPSPSAATCLMEGNNNILNLKSYYCLHCCFCLVLVFFTLIIGCGGFSSYEDWGVDELIVEDSWKRQVGGDWLTHVGLWGNGLLEVLFDVAL